MTKAEKRAALVLELTEIKTAISNIRNGGQGYSIGSGSSGTTRSVTQADLKTLMMDRDDIQSRIDSLDNKRAVKLRCGW